MNAPLFITILDKSIVLFIKNVYPNSHQFVQDNDLNHCSNLAREHYAVCGVNWWPTAPETPDIYPIELVWHELKEYVHPQEGEVSEQTRAD